MYAVIKAGGHQYKVTEGDVITIDKMPGNTSDAVNFSEVLMIGKTTKVGQPVVEGASVDAIIKSQKREPKIIVFKYKRRKNYKKKRGHKQPVTVVEIKKINH